MKKVIIILFVLFNYGINAQSIVDICSGESFYDLPSGSYIKDVDGQLDKFAGTWIWTNGNEEVTFKLQKVVHQYFSEYGTYEDYMIGDYKYTKNNGSLIVVNSGAPPSQFILVDHLLPEFHPMYANCPESETIIDFIFTDIIVDNESCRAIFEFLPGSTTQIKLTQKNREGMGIMINEGDPIPVINQGFTIPNDIILTKQP
jgi:hypothetical protein